MSSMIETNRVNLMWKPFAVNNENEKETILSDMAQCALLR